MTMPSKIVCQFSCSQCSALDVFRKTIFEKSFCVCVRVCMCACVCVCVVSTSRIQPLSWECYTSRHVASGPKTTSTVVLPSDCTLAEGWRRCVWKEVKRDERERKGEQKRRGDVLGLLMVVWLPGLSHHRQASLCRVRFVQSTNSLSLMYESYWVIVWRLNHWNGASQCWSSPAPGPKGIGQRHP